MKEIIAYEMVFDKTLMYQNGIICVPIQEKYCDEYMKIYNECFYKMRKELEVEPINFGYKTVLAFILSKTVAEFKGMSVKHIADLIEGEGQQGFVQDAQYTVCSESG